MKNKTAIILCGGKGSRLGSLGKKIPKTLVKVQNKEILYHHVPQLYLEKNGQEMNLNLILATYILKGE